MRHLDIMKENITFYPKVLLVGKIIRNTGLLKKITTGMPLTQLERNDLLELTMNFNLITDLMGTTENRNILKEYAEKVEVPKFGFKTVDEFQTAWNELMRDYYKVMDEANLGQAGQT